MNCTYCGHELPAGSNPRRAFCHEAHKQAYWREQHQANQSAALLAEVEQLCATVKDQAQDLEEQAGEIARLQALLDVEKRSLADTMQHPFKA